MSMRDPWDWDLCERCGEYAPLEVPYSMTAYHWHGEGRDPNYPGRLCPCCVDEYREWWESQWQEYYASQGF